MIDDGFQYVNSEGGYWQIGPRPCGEDFIVKLHDRVETCTRTAYYKCGPGTRKTPPKTFVKEMKRAGTAAWECNGRFFRILKRQRLSCRKDGNTTKAPVSEKVRGSWLPFKSIKSQCKSFMRVYKFQVLPARYGKEDVDGNDAECLALHADIMYGIVIQPVHNDHELNEHSGITQTPHDMVKELIRKNAEKCPNLWKLMTLCKVEITQHLESIGYPVFEGNRKWFPMVRDYRNILIEKGLEVDRLEELLLNIRDEGGYVHYEYMPDEDPSKTKLLVCYQCEDQQEILRAHGNILCLDSTHKSNKHKLPLFLLVCRTPHGYQVVGFFICKSEHSLGQATIQEALEVFKAWNPGYSPQFTMTDCDQAELNALRAVYPDIQTFLCDFHVKKAWKERLRNLFKDPTLNLEVRPSVTVSAAELGREHAFRLLLTLLYSDTPNIHLPGRAIDDDFNEKLNKVLSDDLCKRVPELTRYIEYWAGFKECWATPYRNLSAMGTVTTNNGTESLNNVIKNKVLGGRGGQLSIPQLVTALVYEFLGNKLSSYKQQMAAESSAYKQLAGTSKLQLPGFFESLPKSNFKKVKASYNLSQKLKGSDYANFPDGSGFCVRTKDGESIIAYKVEVNSSVVSCDCIGFRHEPKLPCKHIFLIMREENIQWDSLPALFRNDPELSVNGYLGIADNSAATTSRAPLLHPVPLSPAPENGQIQSGPAGLDESLASVPGPSTATSPTTSRVAGQHPDPNFYINKMMSGVADLKGKIWGLEPDRLAEATEFVLENFRTHLFPGLERFQQPRKRDFRQTLGSGKQPAKKKKRLTFPSHKRPLTSDSDSDFQ